MTGKRATNWVLAADTHAGRLLRVDRTAGSRPHVAVDDEIHDGLADDERGSSSLLRGGSGHSHASRINAEEMCRARFAKEIAVWLEQKAEDLHIERIAVFAPPRFLAALREAWSPRFAIQVEEHHGDLTHLSPEDLAGHEGITALLAETSI